MSDEELNIISTGESSAPSYDTDSGLIHDPTLNDGAGGKREPSYQETVKAAVLEQKARNDPEERIKQRAERNGIPMSKVYSDLEEVSNIQDGWEQVRWMARRNGINMEAAAAHFANAATQEPDQNYTRAEQEQAALRMQEVDTAVARFERAHPNEPKKSPMRLAASKFLSEFETEGKHTKIFNGAKTIDDLYERAYQAALNDTPKMRAVRKIEEMLSKNDAVVVRSKSADKATI